MKRLPKENEYQLDIKDQFKNEFEIGQLQGNNFHMTDSADLPMLIEPQGNIEQEVIEAVEGIVVEGSSINVNDVDTSYEDSIMPQGNIEQVVVEEIPGNTIEGEIINITNGDSTKEVKAIVHGNSYQETIAEEVGTTVVNKSIHLTDVNTAKESKLAPIGNIQQDTREGYNILDFDVNQDSKVTVNKDGSITLNGNGGFSLLFKPVTLKTGIKYIEKLELISGTITGVSKDNCFMSFKEGSWLFTSSYLTFTPESDTKKSSIWINNAAVFDNATIRIWSYEGDYDSNKAFELPGAMPSLNYPSPVKGVGSEEEINKLPNGIEKTTTISGITFSSNGKGEYKISGTSTASCFYHFLLDEDYTIQEGDFLHCKNNVANSNVAVGFVDTTNGTTLGMGVPSTINRTLDLTSVVGKVARYFRIYLNANQTVDITFTPMIINGDKDVSYTPYGYCRYDTVVGNKNVFNKNGKFTNGYLVMGEIVTASNWKVTDFIPVPDNAETLTVLNGWGKSEIHSFYDEDKKEVYSYSVGNNTSAKIPIKDNYKYLRATVQSTNYDNFMLAFEDTDTFIEYQSQTLPIDIPVGQEWYSGKPYKANGKWYRKVEYAKQELNNSLTITRYVASGFDCYRITGLQNLNNSSNAKIKSNIFKGIVPIYGENAYIANRKVGDIYINNVINAIDMLTKNGEYADATSFINAVAGNYFVYQLATPTVEEITDTTLIEQLEALQNAELYDGVTNINTYALSEDVAEMPLEAHYNFITPSPSVERPSDIEVIEGVNRFDKNDEQLETNKGKYHMSGNRLSNSVYSYLLIENIKPNTDYYYNGVASASTSNVVVFDFYNDDEYISCSYYSKENGKTTTPSNCNKMYVSIPYAEKDTFQITENKDLPYLPYGHIGLVQRGIQLLDYTKGHYINTKVQPEFIDNGFILKTSSQGYRIVSFETNLKANTRYILKCDYEKISGSISEPNLYLSDIEKYIRVNKPFTPEKDSKEISLYLQQGDTETVFNITNIRLYEEQYQNKPYEPYKEPIVKPINLNGNSLAKVNTIKDLLNIGLDGSVIIDDSVGKSVFTGTENWKMTTREDGVVAFWGLSSDLGIPQFLRSPKLCNMFKYINQSYKNVLEPCICENSVVETNLIIFVPFDDEITTLALWKAKLKELYDNGTPLYVLYELATPQTINLPSIKPIKLFDGTNNFELVTNLDTTINMTYNHVGYSPSIVKPSEVKGVSGHYDNVVGNKNLFDMNKFPVIRGVAYVSGKFANWGDYSGIKEYFPVKPNKFYIFSNDLNAKISYGITYYDKNKNVISYTNPAIDVIETPNNCYYIRFAMKTTELPTWCQIEEVPNKSSTATAYIEHQSQSLPIDIPVGQEWYSGKPYKVNGKWYRTIEWYKYILNGTETITYSTGSNVDQANANKTAYFQIALPKGGQYDQYLKDNIYSNMFKNLFNASELWNTNNGSDYESIALRTQARIRINKTRLNGWSNDLTDTEKATLMKNYVKSLYDNGTPIEVVFKLEIPLEPEEITDPVLISQLEALQNAEFYNGVTNINSYRSLEDVANMPLEAHYNFITPSPSIDRPSEVLEVGSEEDINLFDISKITVNKFINGNVGDTYGTTGDSAVTNISDFMEVKANKTYTFKYDYETLAHTNSRGYCYYDTNKTLIKLTVGTNYSVGNKKVTFTPTQDGYIKISYDKNCRDIMFYEGTEDLYYTPYGYCRYKNVVENKNFINLKNLVTGGVGIKVDEENYIYSTSPTADSREYKYRNSNLKLTLPSGTYTLSAIFKTQCTNQYGGISIMNSSDEFITSASIANKNSVTKSFTLSKEMDIGILTKVFDGYMKLQVEKGDTATEIVEHQEQNLPIDLPIGMKMYNDEFFYKENGKWYRPIGWVEKIITSEYLNNLVQFNLQSINSYGIANFLLINSYTDELYTDKNFMYSNYFKNQTSTIANEKENGILAQPKNEYIRISSKIASTTDEFKNWVDELNASGKPLKIYRELAKPYPEEITDANLIAQLEKTLTPFSYYPVTNINSYKPTENVADLKLYVEYFKSNKITNK